MPTYTLRNKNTNEEREEFFTSFSKLTEFLNENKEFETIIRTAPAIVSGVGGLKIADGFNDILKQVKKGSGRNNTINTK